MIWDGSWEKYGILKPHNHWLLSPPYRHLHWVYHFFAWYWTEDGKNMDTATAEPSTTILNYFHLRYRHLQRVTPEIQCYNEKHSQEAAKRTGPQIPTYRCSCHSHTLFVGVLPLNHSFCKFSLVPKPLRPHCSPNSSLLGLKLRVPNSFLHVYIPWTAGTCTSELILFIGFTIVPGLTLHNNASGRRVNSVGKGDSKT